MACGNSAAGAAATGKTAPVPESFACRFAAVSRDRGPLVVGLDPSASLLVSWGLGDTADGLERFVDIALAAAAATVGIVKPQSAFYERHGWRGMRTLERLVREARSAGLLVVLDAKRGDVGSTNDAYGDVYLGPGAPLLADAVTVHPYLGVGALVSLFERAHATGSCVLVVVRSSNPEGRSLQTAVTARGHSVEQALLDEIGAINERLAPGSLGPVGAVVAPTRRVPRGVRVPELDLAAAQAIFLAPGLGTQGATPVEVAVTFAGCPDRVMPSASRSLLQLGPDEERLRDGIATLAGQLRTLLATARS